MGKSQLQRNGFILFLSWENHQHTNQSLTDAELCCVGPWEAGFGEGGDMVGILLFCPSVVDGSLVCVPLVIWKTSNE